MIRQKHTKKEKKSYHVLVQKKNSNANSTPPFQPPCLLLTVDTYSKQSHARTSMAQENAPNRSLGVSVMRGIKPSAAARQSETCFSAFLKSPLIKKKKKNEHRSYGTTIKHTHTPSTNKQYRGYPYS